VISSGYRRQVAPELCFRTDNDVRTPLLVWRFPREYRVISSGPLGGGIGELSWVINTTVPMWYDREDPDTHLLEMAADLGLGGRGAGLMTGVDVAEVVSATESGVTVWVTVGLGGPIQAAAPAEVAASRVGTINVVVELPVPFADSALVNAIATVTEAKVQAMRDLGFQATGTPTDATCLFAPVGAAQVDAAPVDAAQVDAAPVDGAPKEPGSPAEAERYGGPRSAYGSIIARVTYEAMIIGGRHWLSKGIAWSDRIGLSPRGAFSG
jgi:adenosylcobinamide hydrolase